MKTHDSNLNFLFVVHSKSNASPALSDMGGEWGRWESNPPPNDGGAQGAGAN